MLFHDSMMTRLRVTPVVSFVECLAMDLVRKGRGSNCDVCPRNFDSNKQLGSDERFLLWRRLVSQHIERHVGLEEESVGARDGLVGVVGTSIRSCFRHVSSLYLVIYRVSLSPFSC